MEGEEGLTGAHALKAQWLSLLARTGKLPGPGRSIIKRSNCKQVTGCHHEYNVVDCDISQCGKIPKHCLRAIIQESSATIVQPSYLRPQMVACKNLGGILLEATSQRPELAFSLVFISHLLSLACRLLILAISNYLRRNTDSRFIITINLHHWLFNGILWLL